MKNLPPTVTPTAAIHYEVSHFLFRTRSLSGNVFDMLKKCMRLIVYPHNRAVQAKGKKKKKITSLKQAVV